MTKPILALIGATLLVACVETVPVQTAPTTMTDTLRQEARAVLTYDFFDAQSARFRNETSYRLANGDYVMCGQVNGKNRLGGYIGFTDFYVRFSRTPSGPEKRVIQTEYLATSGCAEAAKGSLPIPADQA